MRNNSQMLRFGLLGIQRFLRGHGGLTLMEILALPSGCSASELEGSRQLVTQGFISEGQVFHNSDAGRNSATVPRCSSL